MKEQVYMDHNATTPVAPEVLEAMLPFLTESFGNPSSIHGFGRPVKVALDGARRTIAAALGAEPVEITFTSGGTEADNLALRGVVAKLKDKGNHIIVSRTEHSAILTTCAVLERQGVKITRLPVDEHGRVSPERVADALRDDTVLASILLANNEVGTINPVAEIGSLLKDRRVLFHTDAVQAFGKVPVDVNEMNVDLLSISSHKIYGPKGIGALYIRRGTPVAPIMHGGHQERDRRGGTENVPGIVGFGAATTLALERMPHEATRLSALRDRLEAGLRERIHGIKVNGHPTERLPAVSNISVADVEGESMLMSLDLEGVAVSSGSACSSGTSEPSHVLMAMGVSKELAHASLRFSLGRSNTEEHIDYVLEKLPTIVKRLRRVSW